MEKTVGRIFLYCYFFLIRLTFSSLGFMSGVWTEASHNRSYTERHEAYEYPIIRTSWSEALFYEGSGSEKSLNLFKSHEEPASVRVPLSRARALGSPQMSIGLGVGGVRLRLEPPPREPREPPLKV